MASDYAKVKLKDISDTLHKLLEKQPDLDAKLQATPSNSFKFPNYSHSSKSDGSGMVHSSVFPTPQHDDLSSSFHSMSISSGSGKAHQNNFVGGFLPPQPASLAKPALAQQSLLAPPNVQGQISQTMKYALQTPSQSGPSFPSPYLQPSYLSAPVWQRPASDSALSSAPLSNSLTPPRPTRPRAASATAGSGKDTITVQCAATTKAGHPCKRQVKLSDALFRAYESAITDGEDFEVFCGQHQEIVSQNTHVQSRKKPSIDVKFNEWVPGYLQVATRASIISEMSKSRSQADRPGIIYCFEIIDSEDIPGTTVKLKVGRTVNLGKRISEWDAQCGSKKQVLRYYYPNDGQAVPLLKGTLKTDKTLAWCYRAERLIHLELGDLSASKVYLDPKWPRSGQSTPPSRSSLQNRPQCMDCGKRHKEIFEFTRLKGKVRGREWELIVQPVIEKWGRFVDDHVI